MKLCFSTLSCPTWTLPQIIDAAVANGFQGIDFRGLGEEIDLTRHISFNMELDSTLEEMRRRGLSMPCLNTSVTLVSPSPERWAAMLEECHRYASLAQKTQTPLIRIFGGAVPAGMTREEALMMAQRHLRQVIKICKSFGCRAALETHDDFTRSEDVLTLLHEFSPDEVAVIWDIEHPYRRGEEPFDTANALKRFVRHVHVKDSLRVDGRSEPKLLGEGDLPIAKFIEAMKSIGYGGWLCLETEKRWHAGAPDPEQNLPHFAKAMTQFI